MTLFNPSSSLIIYGNSDRETVRSARMPRRYFATPQVSLYRGDALNILSFLPSNSVDCIVTSPPYYGQRDYEVSGQIGLELDPLEYIAKLINIFEEAKRVLKPTGSLWVNIGDTYWSGKGQAQGEDAKQKHRRFDRPQDRTGVRGWCVPKQLLLIPHRFAIAMQEAGWIVRNDNVWSKPTPMPDPVSDRSAATHEYVFHFVQQKVYYYDMKSVAVQNKSGDGQKAPPSVWDISNDRSHKLHKAVFPERLMALPIQATCPIQGVLLDPFCGTATALVACLQSSPLRKVIGIDISLPALREAKQALLDYSSRPSNPTDENSGSSKKPNNGN